MSYIPKPVTRTDKYLAYIAGNMDVALPDHPITRKEHYLAAWAEKSGFEDVDVAGEPPLTLENAIGKPLKGLTLYGRSKQVATTGVQLLNFNSGNIINRDGMTINISDDGGFFVDGTPQNPYTNMYNSILSLSAGDYYFLGGNGAAGTVYGQITITKPDGTLYYANDGKVTIDGTEKEIKFTIQNGNNTEHIDHYTLYTMLNVGSTPLPWEPYTGGKPSPSPDYPQEIESVGQDGEIGVEVYGGNLFNARTAINGKVVDKHTGSMLSNSRYACSDYIAIPCNAVSLYQNGGTKNQRAFYDSDKNFIAAEVSVNPVTVPKNAKYIRITSEIDKQDMNNIMLSISSTALPYEPYHEPQFASIATPNGLPGIAVSSGGNYTDADGRQWICDEIDFGRGVYVQRVYKSKLADLYSYFDGSGSYSCMISNMSQLQTSVLCNIAKYEFNYNGNGCYIYNNTIVFGTRFCSKFATYDDFKNMIREKYAIAYTVLATPIETPLTSDQLNVYKALRTYKGTTIIDNDAGAYMSVKYEKMK